jgi:uroporphyrinogen decarboxylase
MFMTKREVVRLVLEGKKPPYVPWHFGFTKEPKEKLMRYFRTDNLDVALDNHILTLGNTNRMEDIGNNRCKDIFGVIWDRSVDKDIGVVEKCMLSQPDLSALDLPDPLDSEIFKDMKQRIATRPDSFRVFCIGFSLYERAWTLRGMENLMMDMIENPEFVHGLLDAIADYNVAQVYEACKYDIDGVYFGDDWGQQTGLILGSKLWHEFIFPRVSRMYAAVHEHGKYVFIHSCGKVEELFDDLISAGLNCFNPFQPEVMDVKALMKKYRGRLSFHGGLSMQKTLPFGTPEDVRRESRELLELGKEGNYIFSPSHSVESDTPLENILAFIEEARVQAVRSGAFQTSL